MANRHFEKIENQVSLWLDTLDKSFFEEKDRQKLWDAMNGKAPEKRLIDLLPTDKLKNSFQATIKSYLEESDTKKTLTREDMHHLLVRKMLELTYQNSEYDTLLFRKVNSKVKRIH